MCRKVALWHFSFLYWLVCWVATDSRSELFFGFTPKYPNFLLLFQRRWVYNSRTEYVWILSTAPVNTNDFFLHVVGVHDDSKVVQKAQFQPIYPFLLEESDQKSFYLIGFST